MAKLKGGMALDFSLEKSRVKEEVGQCSLIDCVFSFPFFILADLFLIQKRSCSLANSKGENTSYS